MRSMQLALAFVVLCLVASCGAGTAAAVSGGGSGSGGNSPASIAGFRVLDANDPHRCRVEFALRDPNGDPATVELLYHVPGQSEQRITRILPVVGAPSPPTNPATLPSSANGVEYAFQWEFAGEASLPHDGGFVEGASVFARVGTAGELLPGANLHSGIGNDAPVVLDASAPKAAEVAGITAVPFTVADTSADAISIRVEYDVVGDAPDVGWRVARPAGIPASLPTPAIALAGVVAPPSPGVDLVFFWDTNFDLHELELDVALRFTPADAVVFGTSFSTPVFRVDNNAAPAAALREGQFLANGDGRRGIVIPFDVSDDEADAIDLVFQWRRSTESFPSLPADAAQVRAIVADPLLRRQYRVCSELPRVVEGHLVPIDAAAVELPELASSAAHALAQGIVGLELEILRPSNRPELVSDAWPSNPLVAPVGALPIDGGASALVLDAPAPGTWRLARLDLASGEARAGGPLEVASGSGSPTALCSERGEDAVLVATHRAGAWRVDRVAIETGTVTPLVSADRSTGSGEIRGIASLGRHACLVTFASSLVRLDWSNPTKPAVVALFDDLSTPWGVAVDTSAPNRIFLAERDARTETGIGRVQSIRLDTLERRTLYLPPVQVLEDVVRNPINRPQALAFDRARGRLLAIAQREPGDETHELLALELNASGVSRMHELRTGLPAVTGGVAIGAEQTIIVARTSDGGLDVGGGVEQRRTIVGWEGARRRVEVDAPLRPVPRSGQPWRIAYERRAVPGISQGTFLWDSRDVPSGGDVLVRVTPLDAEVGAASQSSVPKRLVTPVEGSESELAGSGTAVAIIAADIDGDGDVDLASANYIGDSLTIFWQTAAGTFATPPMTLGAGSSTDAPRFLTAADLDGDGDLDLASANEFSGTLSIFWQLAPGTFDPTPTLLGGPTVTGGAYSLAAADLDRDGDQDLVSANVVSDTLTVFWQTSPGSFSATPTVLGDSTTTDSPRTIATADVDGDGDLDLVSANDESDTLTVFWQQAGAAFDPVPTVVGGPSTINGPQWVSVADLDGDGDLDLASANGNSDTLSVFWQSAAGLFDPQPTLLVVGLNPGVVDGPFSVVAADIDQDGDLDLTSSNIWNDTLSVYWQTGDGVFDPIPAVLGGGFPYIDCSAVAADIDGDRDLDLITASNLTESLRVYRQSSPGEFDPVPDILAGLPTIDGPLSVAAADIEGDGDIDLVSANRWTNSLTVFRQDGAGAFDPVPLTVGAWPTIEGPSSTTATDVDGDGDLDLVSANSASNTLSVFWQTGECIFDPAPTLFGSSATTAYPQSVAVADVDGDGRLDLISANMDSHSLTVFWRTAVGFESAPTVIIGWPIFFPGCVAAADVDGDGDLDVVSANRDSSSLVIAWQVAPRVFGSQPTQVTDFSAFDGPVFVSVADIDHDGDADLVSANEYSDTVKIFWQSAPGAFDSVPTVLGGFPTIDEPRSVIPADLDADGDLDLVSANYLSSTVTVFWQRGSGMFDPVPTVLEGVPGIDGTWFVSAPDIDLDGDLDLVVANFGSKQLLVYWGGR